MPQCFTIMNNDNNHNTIQEFDVNLICDFFLNTLSSTYKCNFLGADNKQ